MMKVEGKNSKEFAVRVGIYCEELVVKKLPHWTPDEKVPGA